MNSFMHITMLLLQLYRQKSEISVSVLIYFASQILMSAVATKIQVSFQKICTVLCRTPATLEFPPFITKTITCLCSVKGYIFIRWSQYWFVYENGICSKQNKVPLFLFCCVQLCLCCTHAGSTASSIWTILTYMASKGTKMQTGMYIICVY